MNYEGLLVIYNHFLEDQVVGQITDQQFYGQSWPISCSYNDKYRDKRFTFDCKLELHEAKLPIGDANRWWCKLLSSVLRRTTDG